MKPDRVLDCRGLLCPMPIVKTAKALKELQVGEVLEMLATDPGSKADMVGWARQTRHELLETEERGGEFIFYIRRTH